MSANRLTLDTNILIYAIDRDAKDKHERAISIVDQAMHLDCVLTLQALCEFYSAATRKKHANHDEASSFIKELMVIFPVIASSSKTLSLALKTMERNSLSFWDALLWATAKENSCSLIISEDFQDNFILGGVKIKNPFYSEDSLESYLEK
ncbi:MAG: PIN domain-containing protein [Alphaproteobacteria bacterium]|nr:PIN domain-containing protein [Alphaproteobacteria bacterium]